MVTATDLFAVVLERTQRCGPGLVDAIERRLAELLPLVRQSGLARNKIIRFVCA